MAHTSPGTIWSCMNGCSQPNDFPTTTVKRPPYPKRLMDVTICVLLLPLWGAAILILGMLCLVLQGRPVFFAQQRPGLLGRPFTMYKLRTMRSGIPGAPDQEAARTTGFGRLLRRTHLDELPEFWNILRGDMSLVGPRPCSWNTCHCMMNGRCADTECDPVSPAWPRFPVATRFPGKRLLPWTLPMWRRYVLFWTVGYCAEPSHCCSKAKSVGGSFATRFKGTPNRIENGRRTHHRMCHVCATPPNSNSQ